MPRYRPESPYGYDLDLEFPFIIIDGEKIRLGTAGSIIQICPTCGEETFRMEVRHLEQCFRGHGELELFRLADKDKYNAMWLAQGDTVTTLAERKARRLDEEQRRPWNWWFGHQTEADFPDGFAEIDGVKLYRPNVPVVLPPEDPSWRFGLLALRESDRRRGVR